MGTSQIQPIFILGSPRSGTTLLQRVLNTYDDVLIWGQHSGFLDNLSAAFYTTRRSSDRFKDVRPLNRILTDSEPDRTFQALMNWCGKEDWINSFRHFMDDFFLPDGLPGKQFWGFKEVRYLCHSKDRTLEFLHEFYPEAIFVFIIRNPYNSLSSRKIDYGIKTLLAFKKTCVEWKSQNQAFWNWHTQGKSRSFWIAYEDFIEEQGDILKLLACLGKTLGDRQRDILKSREGRGSAYADDHFHDRWKSLPRPWLALAHEIFRDPSPVRNHGEPPLGITDKILGKSLRSWFFLYERVKRLI